MILGTYIYSSNQILLSLSLHATSGLSGHRKLHPQSRPCSGSPVYVIRFGLFKRQDCTQQYAVDDLRLDQIPLTRISCHCRFSQQAYSASLILTKKTGSRGNDEVSLV